MIPSNYKLPCVDCICVPVCINKQWLILTAECQLVKQYMGDLECALPRGESITVSILNRVYHLSRSDTNLIVLKVENPKTKTFEMEGYDLDYGQRIHRKI
jgi:hypothetical protein